MVAALTRNATLNAAFNFEFIIEPGFCVSNRLTYASPMSGYAATRTLNCRMLMIGEVGSVLFHFDFIGGS